MVSIEYYDGKMKPFVDIDFPKVLAKYVFTCYGQTEGDCADSDNIDDWVAEIDDLFEGNQYEDLQVGQQLRDAWGALQKENLYRLVENSNNTVKKLFSNVTEEEQRKIKLTSLNDTTFVGRFTGAGAVQEGEKEEIMT